MSALSAPVAVVAVVVAFAACAKVLDPTTTVGALRAAGVAARDAMVRAGALVELGVALAVLVSGARVALVTLGLSYLGFTLFVVLALRSRRPLATCGCVGRADSPPSRIHVVLDALAAAVLVAAAVVGVDAPARVVTSVAVPEAVTFVLLVATGAALFGAAITTLPVLLALRSPTRA
jgi:hypothetical protein